MMEKIVSVCKATAQKASKLAKFVCVWLSDVFTRLLANKKLATAVSGGIVLAVAVIIIILLAVNVWSWTDVTVNLPYELYVSCTDAVSGSDSENEFIADVAFLHIAESTVLESDVVSSSDAVSGSDVVSLSMHIKKKQTVRDILDLAGIILDEAYSVDRQLSEIITESTVISIYKMKSVTIHVDGMTLSTYTSLDTVGELLSEQMIVLAADDRISCDIAAKLANAMAIVINRVTIVEEVRTESVPFKTEERENSSMYKEESEVVVEGVDGSRKVTYRLTYVDGVLESSEVTDEVITVEPVNRVIEVGTKKRPTTTTKKTNSGRYVVSREKVYDCDGSGHGYYIITYSDGTVAYQDF